MADHALAEALRIALEGLVKQRQTAGENLRRQRAAVESAVHNLEKVKEAESIATRDANEKSDNLQALIDLSNSKPPEERSAFQGAITILQHQQLTAAKTRDSRVKLVSDQEKNLPLRKARVERERGGASRDRKSSK